MIYHYCAMYQDPYTKDICYIDGTMDGVLVDGAVKYRSLKEGICLEHADRLVILSLTVLKG